jgi:hypothetical protein
MVDPKATITLTPQHRCHHLNFGKFAHCLSIALCSLCRLNRDCLTVSDTRRFYTEYESHMKFRFV